MSGKAQKAFDKRTKRQKGLDSQRQAKIAPSLEAYEKAPNRYDWPGVDTVKKESSSPKPRPKPKLEPVSAGATITKSFFSKSWVQPKPANNALGTVIAAVTVVEPVPVVKQEKESDYIAEVKTDMVSQPKHSASGTGRGCYETFFPNSKWGKEIGRGTFGSVHTVSPQNFVVKIHERIDPIYEGFSKEDVIRNLQLVNEWGVGPKIYGIIHCGEGLVTVMERYDGAIFKIRLPVSWRAIEQLLAQLKTLHSHQYIHGDLNWGNVLYRQTNGVITEMVLVDFDFMEWRSEPYMNDPEPVAGYSLYDYTMEEQTILRFLRGMNIQGMTEKQELVRTGYYTFVIAERGDGQKWMTQHQDDIIDDIIQQQDGVPANKIVQVKKAYEGTPSTCFQTYFPGESIGESIGSDEFMTVFATSDPSKIVKVFKSQKELQAEFDIIYTEVVDSLLVMNRLQIGPAVHAIIYCDNKLLAVMERLDGNVAEMEGPLSLAAAQNCMDELKRLHDHGLQHGNIHDGNVLYRKKNGVIDKLYLTDYYMLAKLDDREKRGEIRELAEAVIGRLKNLTPKGKLEVDHDTYKLSIS